MFSVKTDSNILTNQCYQPGLKKHLPWQLYYETKISSTYKHLDSGSGQIRTKETAKSFAGTCKNCAIPAFPDRDEYCGTHI